MRSAFIRAITAAAAEDERIVLLTADLGYKLFDEFAERFPGRFLNMGVCEANMVSVAAGLALEGRHVFTYSIVPFATIRCLEQIRNDVCLMRLPVTVVGVGAGYAYGVNGSTHHGTEDVGVMRALPHMTVVSPCDPREAEKATAALVEKGMPSYLRLGRAGEPCLPGTDAPFALDRPTILREGRGVALLACGSVAGEALSAAEILGRAGSSPLVLSVHTLKPLCRLTEVLRARHVTDVVTIEEHGSSGGLMEAVGAQLLSSPPPPRVVGLHCPDGAFDSCGSQDTLRRQAGLDAASIAAKVRQLSGGTP